MYGYNLGYNITSLGSKLNYLKWFNSYLSRVEDDSGAIESDSFSKSVYKILDKRKLQTDMKLAIIAEGGLKTRTFGVEKYVAKAYDLSDANNDAVQTTENSQPLLGGRIAPNEIQNFKSVTGVTKILTHTDIAISDTYTIIKALNAEDSGKTVVSFSEVNSGTYNSISWTGKLYAYMIYGGTISEANQIAFEADLLALVAEVESVVIGEQEWATSNLEMVATPMGNVIPNVTDATEWSNATTLYDDYLAANPGDIEGAAKAAAMWCYYNNDSEIGAVYGKLYNWHAVKLLQNDIDVYNAANPSAPWGWHVPTVAETVLLRETLDPNGSAESNIAGGKIKVAGFDYWNSPNTGADNSSGFSVVGGGLRFSSGVFSSINVEQLLWTSQFLNGTDKAYRWNVYNYNDFLNARSYSSDMREGGAIHLIKD